MNHFAGSWTGLVHTQAPASRLDVLWPTEPGEPTAGKHRFILSDPVFELLAEGTGSRHETLFRSLMEIGMERLLEVEFSERLILVSLSSRSAENAPAPPTISEKLSTIRKAFGMSMAALAEVVQASRASLYNWFENKQPSPAKAERIDRLFRFAQEWEAKSPYHYPPGKLVRQRLGERPSLFERLARDPLDTEEIREGMERLLALMAKQREKMDRAKARTRRAGNRKEILEETLERLTGSVGMDDDG